MGDYSTKITDPDVTVSPNECAVCEPWKDCLWATSDRDRSKEISTIWFYVIGVSAVALTLAVAVAFALCCRARQAADEKAAATPSTAVQQAQSDA